MRRAHASLLALLLLAVCIAGPGSANVASAAPQPKKEGPPPPKPGVVAIPLGGEFQENETDSMLNGLPRTYQALVRRFGTMSPADSMGEGAYRWADAAFTAGKFDDAGKGYLDFARRYPRNLKVNDALLASLLIKESRDFEDQPLLLYARGRALRTAGKSDSAAVVLADAAARYPGAKVRHHVHLMLAEIARSRGDHATALRWAVAGADTARSNRLAPLALRLAAESSVALGEPPQKALAFYKVILERYPRSPVTPEARSRSLEIRKRMPQ